MVAVINGGVAGDLNPGFAGAQAPVATAIAVPRLTKLSTSIGDALSAQVSYGWDQVAGSARVVGPFASASIDDALTATFGSGINVLQRFAGTVRQVDTVLSPHAVTIDGKGPLYLLEEYENNVETISADEGKPGLDFETLVGGSTATLRQIVTAVLTIAGVTYSLANLANPAHLYGTNAPELLTWDTGETAAAYLHRVLEASAGYRLFDSSDGNVYLLQVSAIPSSSPDYIFTLGKDIFGESRASTSSIGQRGAVLVHGYDDGSGPATSGLVGSGSIFRVNSQLVETNAFALELANFWLPQVNRRQRVVRLSTPRDELIGPGQTIFVDGAGGLSVSETMYVKSCVAEMAQSGAITQHLVCTAGAS